jgi:hypothetical protein
MSRNSFIAMLALTTLALFSGLILAQQTNPRQDKSGQMRRGMMGGGMMGPMMAQHQELSQLMNQMLQSMTAINSEKDPARLKALLAEHAALLDQMRSKMVGQGNMMQNMAGQMKNCPGMGGATQPASK